MASFADAPPGDYGASWGARNARRAPRHAAAAAGLRPRLSPVLWLCSRPQPRHLTHTLRARREDLQDQVRGRPVAQWWGGSVRGWERCARRRHRRRRCEPPSPPGPMLDAQRPRPQVRAVPRCGEGRRPPAGERFGSGTRRSPICAPPSPPRRPPFRRRSLSVSLPGPQPERPVRPHQRHDRGVCVLGRQQGRRHHVGRDHAVRLPAQPEEVHPGCDDAPAGFEGGGSLAAAGGHSALLAAPPARIPPRPWRAPSAGRGSCWHGAAAEAGAEGRGVSCADRR